MQTLRTGRFLPSSDAMVWLPPLWWLGAVLLLHAIDGLRRPQKLTARASKSAKHLARLKDCKASMHLDEQNQKIIFIGSK